jgi:putative DNA primase/helicase
LKWDGVPRLEIFLTKFLGVETNIFTSDLSRNILCAALVPVFELGVKFNFLMILEGKQGKVID